MTLLDDEFAPITSVIGFLRMDLDDVTQAFASWRKEHHRSVVVTPVRGDLRTQFAALAPLTSAVQPRELVLSTRSEWTAIFDCGLDGGDPSSSVGHLCETLGTYGLVVCSIPDTTNGEENPGRYGALQFEMFGPSATDFLNSVRSLSLVNDEGKWRFDAAGTVQDFEDVAAYQSKRIRNRFTLEMLQNYASELGVEPFDPSFYGTDGMLVENSAVLPRGEKSLSLESAQHHLGIRP
jgi:hypothetical protein